MVYREIVAEAKQLPLDEQLQLIEELTRAIRRATVPSMPIEREDVIPFRLLRGALRPAGPLPADRELTDAYVDHLVEKYL
jgi:hypothetical protein